MRKRAKKEIIYVVYFRTAFNVYRSNDIERTYNSEKDALEAIKERKIAQGPNTDVKYFVKKFVEV